MTTFESAKIEELSIKVDDLQDGVNQIKTALLGNEFNMQKGMIAKVEDHDLRIKKLEGLARDNKIIISILATIGVAIVSGVVAFIFKK